MPAFEPLFDRTDPLTDEQLEWEWDGELRAFTAVDSHMRRYILTPTEGVMEIDDSERDEDEPEDE